MKFRRFVLVALMAAILGPLIASCGMMDPRRNCNHPEHTKWVKERQQKGKRF